MVRGIAAGVLALALTPAVVCGQTPTFTVAVPSADVHKGPSTATPVIGHVARGTALPISRNLGSWVRIAWPAAPDGVGYVHVTMGRLSGDRMEPSSGPAGQTPASAPRTAPAPPASASAGSQSAAERAVGVQGPQGVTTISHVIGVGGLVQAARSFGATARVWRDRVGVEVRLTRNTMTSDTATARVRSTEFEPRVVFVPFDRLTDYVWFRPYVGTGVTFSRQSLADSSPATIATQSVNKTGIHVFGGSELTFAGATRFGVSAEAGYRSLSTPFAGYEPNRFSVGIAAHWYIK